MPMQDKTSKWRVVFVSLLLTVIPVAIFILAINQYCSGAVGYDRLEQREYTFVRYEITSGRYGGAIAIYVEEENLPLLGSPNFVRRAVDEGILDGSHKGDKLTVWVSVNSSSNYSFNVHEGNINGKYFLRLKDYQKYHGSNDIFGIVLTSVMLVCGPVGAGAIIYHYRKGTSIV